MQILDLSGMHFDAAVVFVTKSSLFIQIGSGHTVSRNVSSLWEWRLSIAMLQLLILSSEYSIAICLTTYYIYFIIDVGR